MKVRSLLITTSLIATVAVIATAFSMNRGANGFSIYNPKFSGSKSGREITITYSSSYRALYYGDDSQDLNIVAFDMDDNQAYGNIHCSGSINISPADNCIATIWSNYPSGTYFTVNDDYYDARNYYFDKARKQPINFVKFRTLTKMVVVLDTSDTNRYTDLTCSDGSISHTGTDSDSKTFTWTASPSAPDYNEVRINAQGSGQVLWIRSITFTYDC